MKLIVGVDSGRTRAIAIMNLNGELLSIRSGKELDRRTIISEIIRYGTPVIVACDRARPGNLVKKIASAFDAKLVHPSKNLSVKKKRKLVSDLSPDANSFKVGNTHERDALASAVFALKLFRKLFYKIDCRSPPEVKDTVKELVLKHKSPNIKEALRVCRRLDS